MNYAMIDPIISRWAAKQCLTLYTHWLVYTSYAAHYLTRHSLCGRYASIQKHDTHKLTYLSVHCIRHPKKY